MFSSRFSVQRRPVAIWRRETGSHRVTRAQMMQGGWGRGAGAGARQPPLLIFLLMPHNTIGQFLMRRCGIGRYSRTGQQWYQG